MLRSDLGRNPPAVPSLELGLEVPHRGRGPDCGTAPRLPLRISLEKVNGLGDGNIARGGVVEVVQKQRDLCLFEIGQQVEDSVYRGIRRAAGVSRHLGRRLGMWCG